MLKVKSSIAVESIDLQIDDYVPITLECSDVSVPLPLYWRTGDFKNSLITVGLNPENGAICSIVLTQIESFKRITEESLSNIQHFFLGVPVCEVTNWDSNRYKDEKNDFGVSIMDNSVLITFGKSLEALTQYQLKNVMFYVDAEKCICALKFNDIQQADIERIIDSVSC